MRTRHSALPATAAESMPCSSGVDVCHSLVGQIVAVGEVRRTSADRDCEPKQTDAEGDQAAACKAMRAAFSPIMIDGALVLPDVRVGMIEASATR